MNAIAWMTEKAECRLAAIPIATVSVAEGITIPENPIKLTAFSVDFFGSSSN